VLAVHAVDLAVRAHGGCVEEVALEEREAEHGHRPPRAGRDLLHALLCLRHEGGPQEKVFGRVPGDRQLGEHNEVAAIGLGPLVRLDDARRVALEVTDDEVQLRERDAKPGHALKDTAGPLVAVGLSRRSAARQ
jgi:hypothetical protein